METVLGMRPKCGAGSDQGRPVWVHDMAVKEYAECVRTLARYV